MSITTTAPTIDVNGITAPSYADVLAYLQAQYQSIYGADVYLGADSQDGQFLGVLAAAINDANAVAVGIYNSFSPSTGQGAALSSNVKINGIAREIASYSTVDMVITGQSGATITNGVVTDTNRNRWSLPTTVVIPPAGTITVTAICQTLGAVTALAGTVTTIATPTLGWQTANNVSAAAPGAPVESDAALRKRQTISTALPSQSILDGIVGAVAALAGVTRYAAFENSTGTTDANGIPGHSISLVVEGGDAPTIGKEIAFKKTPGTGTYGTTSEVIIDPYSNPETINFYRPTNVPIAVAITVKALSGYSSAIGAQLQQAIADYINALVIGGGVLLTKLYLPANLFGGVGSATYEVTVLQIARSPATPAGSDLVLAFNEVATCTTSLVTLTVV